MAAKSYILYGYQRKVIHDTSRGRFWCASRQIGKSFTVALDAAVKSQDDARGDILLLSASQRQSKALMRKFYMHLRALRDMSRAESLALKENKEECELAGGNTVLSLPANPDTARGFSGHVYLDEFAIHRDARSIWTALLPSITRGHSITITTTPLGRQGKSWDLWSKNESLSRHTTTIHDAVADGLEIDPEGLRLLLDDEEAWQQEYLCEWLAESEAFLPHEVISACEYDPDDPALEWPAVADTYLGMDIGRKKDLTVIWPLVAHRGGLWSKDVLVLDRQLFAVQREVLFARLSQARRACLDATGLGMQLAEEALTEYGPARVEPVSFTGAIKESLAWGLKRAMEDRRLRIPIDREIHGDFHSLKKVVTAAGNVRFDVDSSETKGHADRVWACALAVMAAGDGRPANAWPEGVIPAGRRAA